MIYKHIYDEEHIENIIDRFQEVISHQPDQAGKKVSFSSGYLAADNREGYKVGVYVRAIDALDVKHWKKSMIRSGEIAERAVIAMNVKDNNFVDYRHKDDFEKAAKLNPVGIGMALYNLFKTDNDAATLEELVKYLGRPYDTISFLFFLKDSDNYFPCRPRNFRNSFSLLGMDITCFTELNYDNYCAYNEALKELATLYSNYAGHITVLDAHSFAWVIYKYPFVHDYIFNADSSNTRDPKKEGTAVTKTRLNQSEFRANVINAWGGRCAVTDCTITEVLEAAHIKGWKDCKLNDECISQYNGLLLTPNLHALFDKGLISFDENGIILISDRLSQQNQAILGIKPNMKLRKVDPEREKYLRYHRTNVFR